MRGTWLTSWCDEVYKAAELWIHSLKMKNLWISQTFYNSALSLSVLEISFTFKVLFVCLETVQFAVTMDSFYFFQEHPRCSQIF